MQPQKYRGNNESEQGADGDDSTDNEQVKATKQWGTPTSKQKRPFDHAARQQRG